MPLADISTRATPQNINVGTHSVSLDQNVFFADFEKPEWDEFIFNTNRKYSQLTMLLEANADFSANTGYMTTNNGNFRHIEFGAIYKKELINAAPLVTAPGGASTTAVVRLASTTEQYIIKEDVIMLPVVDPGSAGHLNSGTNVFVKVNLTGTDGGNQTVTVESLDGVTNLQDAWFPADGELTVITNLFGECSDIDTGRKYFPTFKISQVSKTRTYNEVCDWAAEKVTYAGGQYWMMNSQMLKTREHRRMVEGKLMFVPGNNNSTLPTGDGVIPTLEQFGQKASYAGALSETEIIQWMDLLDEHGASLSNDYFHFAGRDQYNEITNVMKPYFLNGGVDYGPFGRLNEVGIKWSSYRFQDNTFHLAKYHHFTDPKFLASGGTNFANYGVTLCGGNLQKGTPKIEACYKIAPSKEIVRMLYYNNPGPLFAKSGSQVSTMKECFKESWTTEMGIRMVDAKTHGIFRQQ